MDLPQMLQYVSSSDFVRLDSDDVALPSVKSLLSRISNSKIREIILDMTQRQPDRRRSVSEYLDILQGKNQSQEAANKEPNIASASSSAIGESCCFPPYFDGFLYPLFLKLHWNGITPDLRIHIICEVSTFVLGS